VTGLLRSKDDSKFVQDSFGELDLYTSAIYLLKKVSGDIFLPMSAASWQHQAAQCRLYHKKCYVKISESCENASCEMFQQP
jgi:hypothetical protein